MLFDEKVDLFVQELCARRSPTSDKSILFDNITIRCPCNKNENEDLQKIT